MGVTAKMHSYKFLFSSNIRNRASDLQHSQKLRYDGNKNILFKQLLGTFKAIVSQKTKNSSTNLHSMYCIVHALSMYTVSITHKNQG